MTITTDPATPRRGWNARSAAITRWNGHPAVRPRLSDLTPAQARLVRALIAAARAVNAEADVPTTKTA